MNTPTRLDTYHSYLDFRDHAAPHPSSAWPVDWEAESQALAVLRRMLAEGYRGTQILRQASLPLRAPLPLYLGF